ncbi:aminotransferase class I/II-fold pyridoxal phosphate-dependent enzyme [Echinicola jeungdonensis]|nr:aminotransferase class I/II-fold pyridoxal phosphate-dependent enzyme [Echinicola jeungdonensis]MDN3671237.1 aminotransferase class I/II-fold pyridoxal phosphate-dependent enzyme [Echinicola jeungdonensis]
MDGDFPDLAKTLSLCEQYNAGLIIDEAHSLGTLGEDQKGLAHQFRNHPHLLARVITFGKAAGSHGAMVLGSEELIQFLVNFSRAFIYTTAPSFEQVMTLNASWKLLEQKTNFQNLEKIIQKYLELVPSKANSFSKNKSPIQAWFCSDIGLLKQKAARLNEAGFNVYPILSPTVKKGTERIRIVLHAFNTPEEISQLIEILNH